MEKDITKEIISESKEKELKSIINWQDEDISNLHKEIDELTLERDDYKDKYLRVLADCENIRKRDNEIIKNLRTNANEGLMKSLLETIDNFERAFNNYNENASKLSKKGIEILEGMSNIYKSFCTTLKSYGLMAININVGDTFNVDTMEAVSVVPGNNENTVEHIMCKGYTYNNKVIRYAKVIVKK